MAQKDKPSEKKDKKSVNDREKQNKDKNDKNDKGGNKEKNNAGNKNEKNKDKDSNSKSKDKDDKEKSNDKNKSNDSKEKSVDRKEKDQQVNDKQTTLGDPSGPDIPDVLLDSSEPTISLSDPVANVTQVTQMSQDEIAPIPRPSTASARISSQPVLLNGLAGMSFDSTRQSTPVTEPSNPTFTSATSLLPSASPTFHVPTVKADDALSSASTPTTSIPFAYAIGVALACVAGCLVTLVIVFKKRRHSSTRRPRSLKELFKFQVPAHLPTKNPTRISSPFQSPSLQHHTSVDILSTSMNAGHSPLSDSVLRAPDILLSAPPVFSLQSQGLVFPNSVPHDSDYSFSSTSTHYLDSHLHPK